MSTDDDNIVEADIKIRAASILDRIRNSLPNMGLEPRTITAIITAIVDELNAFHEHRLTNIDSALLERASIALMSEFQKRSGTTPETATLSDVSKALAEAHELRQENLLLWARLRQVEDDLRDAMRLLRARRLINDAPTPSSSIAGTRADRLITDDPSSRVPTSQAEAKRIWKNITEGKKI